MADKSASPFTGLDKALIRSTSKQSSAQPREQVPPETMKEVSRPRSPSSSARTNGRTNGRTDERAKIRHSFDIYRDQLLELADIQADVFRKTGKKPKVGELVQEALDAYITKYQKGTK